jgi:succinyl-CoA synthetase beta subunit
LVQKFWYFTVSGIEGVIKDISRDTLLRAVIVRATDSFGARGKIGGIKVAASGLQLMDFLRTVLMALPIDGWLMLLAFHFPSLYLRIALGSSGSLCVTAVSSAVGEPGIFLVEQSKNTKISEHWPRGDGARDLHPFILEGLSLTT